jgi:hypothetical protein
VVPAYDALKADLASARPVAEVRESLAEARLAAIKAADL